MSGLYLRDLLASTVVRNGCLESENDRFGFESCPLPTLGLDNIKLETGVNKNCMFMKFFY